jgi:allophanate hydrolase subunit 2
MSGFSVKQPGLLSLLQDRGRYGAHRLGLTTGGPLDHLAFDWANRLIGNDANATCVEISFGGLSLEAETETSFVITGAQAPCKLNGEAILHLCGHTLLPGSARWIRYRAQFWQQFDGVT